MEINIEEHLGLVKSIARRFKTIEYDDAYQSGCEGLIVAASRFKDDGASFSTFATQYITGYIYNFMNSSQFMRTPQKLRTLNTKVAKLEKQGYSHDDISKELSLPIETIKEASIIFNKFTNTDDSISEIIDEDIDIENQCIRKSEFEEVMKHIGKMPKKQGEIILERFYHDKSQSEVGLERNRTRQAIQNAEKLGLNNIRKSLGIA